MDSEVFVTFLTKMCEVEKMYQTFKKEDQEISLKVLVSLCKRFEMVLGPSYSMTTYMLYTTQGIEDYFIQVTSSVMQTVRGGLEESTNSVFDYPDERKLESPATLLRVRKTQLIEADLESQGLAETVAFSPDEDVNDYDSAPCEKRKRKQACPRQTMATLPVTRRVSTRRRKPSSAKILPVANIHLNPVPEVKAPVAVPFLARVDPDSMSPANDGIQNVTLNHGEVTRIRDRTKPNSIQSNSINAMDTLNPQIKLLIKSHLEENQSSVVKRKRGRPPKRVTYDCEKCPKTFTHRQSLLAHCSEAHLDAPRCCRNCRKEFLNEVDSEHRCRRKGNNSAKVCRVCGQEFPKVMQLRRHMQQEHRVRRKVFSYFCRFCGKGFVKQTSMFGHYKEHAGGQYVCMRCGEFTPDYDAYKEHLSRHQKHQKYSCERCGKKFHRERRYLQHVSAHRQHTCIICQKSLTSHRGLAKHMVLEHREHVPLEQRAYPCHVCNKVFPRPGMLTVHMRLHTGEKPVECGPCQLFFRTNKALAKHRQTYSHCVRAGEEAKERRYLCQECGKAYFRKHALQRHMRYHTGEKPHMCQHCGYKCREANNLKRHMALHFEGQRNYVCEMCGAAFHAKKTLEMHHAYKHSEERKFQCPDCPMSFKAKNALRRHSKVHSVEKEHKCWCGTAFKRMYNLRRHLRSVHGTDEMLPPVRRVSTLDCSKKLPVSKTDIIEKADHHDLLLQDAIVASVSMVTRQNRLQPTQPLQGTQQHSQTSAGVAVTMATDPNTHIAAQTQETDEVLHYTTPMPAPLPTSLPAVLPSSLSTSLPTALPSSLPSSLSTSLPTSLATSLSLALAEHQLSLTLQSQAVGLEGQSADLTTQDPGLGSQVPGLDQHIQDTHHHDNQSQLGDQQVQTMTPEELAQRLRYVQDPNSLYSTTADPRDPFSQVSTSLGTSNIIPQALAYSNIVREYGGQFPFLQDGTLYQYVK